MGSSAAGTLRQATVSSVLVICLSGIDALFTVSMELACLSAKLCLLPVSADSRKATLTSDLYC